MTKNGRRLLFLLVATVANMALTILIFVALILLYGVTLGRVLSAGSTTPAIFISFMIAVVLSGFVYTRVLKSLRKRPDLEEKFGLLK